MWRTGLNGDAIGHLHARDFERDTEIARPVVDPRQDMGMQIDHQFTTPDPQ